MLRKNKYKPQIATLNQKNEVQRGTTLRQFTAYGDFMTFEAVSLKLLRFYRYLEIFPFYLT